MSLIERPRVVRQHPAAPAQTFYVAVESVEPGGGNFTLRRSFPGPYDEDALAAAGRGLLARHPALRTGLRRTRAGLPAGDWRRYYLDYRQVVADEVALPLVVAATLGDRPDTEPFRLAVAPLFRMRAAPTAQGGFVVGITTHHAIGDGWSQQVLWRDLERLYVEALGRPVEPLPSAGRSFGDFVEEDFRTRSTGGWDRSIAFWCRQLAGVRLRRLPAPGADGGSPGAGSLHHELTPSERAALQALAAAGGASPFAAVLGLYALALRDVVGGDEMVVSTPFANRRRPETWDVVGVFANVVLLRLRFEGAPTPAEVVRQAWGLTLRTLAHGHVSMDAIAQHAPAQDWAAVEDGARIGIRQFGGEVPAPEGKPERPGAGKDYGFQTDLLLDCGFGASTTWLRLTWRPHQVDSGVAEDVFARLRALLGGP